MILSFLFGGGGAEGRDSSLLEEVPKPGFLSASPADCEVERLTVFDAGSLKARGAARYPAASLLPEGWRLGGGRRSSHSSLATRLSPRKWRQTGVGRGPREAGVLRLSILQDFPPNLWGRRRHCRDSAVV